MFSKEDGLDAAPGAQMGDRGFTPTVTVSPREPCPRLGTERQQEGLEIKEPEGEAGSRQVQQGSALHTAPPARGPWFLSPLQCPELSPVPQPWGWPES